MISATATKLVLNLDNLDEYKAKSEIWEQQKGLNSFHTAASPEQAGNLSTSFGSRSRERSPQFDPNDPKQVADKRRRERLGMR